MDRRGQDELLAQEAGRSEEVENQFDELRDYNLFETDVPLQAALEYAGAQAFVPSLRAYGARLGSAHAFALAGEADRHPPELRAFDSRGRRVEQVDFHPAWHEMMSLLRGQGLVSLPFRDHRPGRWAAWAAGFYLHGQVEAGTLCPATMTQASIPVLQKEPGLWAQLQERLWSDAYDARDLPVERKASVWIGMGMTEKQGGSDVRSNTTRALPLRAAGRGAEYRLQGHKWFFSAPMCDAHLVIAREPEGHSCFYVPRWCPDGRRNRVHLQRLKSKVGNRSNSSSEVEFDDAWGVLLGEPGRGIPTIIEMATYTRLNCVVGSAAMLRQGLVQALAYARKRRAFGKTLAEHPLMRSVLADLALESEAALWLALRLAQAFENDAEEIERAWKRILTPAAKFWVCKRAIALAAEAMEVLGGNGYVEESVLGRLFREAPVNSIWEGSGNVMCLDVLRGLGREPQAAIALLETLADGVDGDARLEAACEDLRRRVRAGPEALEAVSRGFVERLVLLTQAALLRRQAPAEVADAFVRTRFDARWGRVAGAIELPDPVVQRLLDRAWPA